MKRLAILVASSDRPGLLQGVSKSLADLGVNIVASVGYVDRGVARLLFIVDSPIDEPPLSYILSRSLGPASIEAGRLGEGSGRIIAGFLAPRPSLMGVLEYYLDPADMLDAALRLPRSGRIEAYRTLSPRTLAGILEAAGEDEVRFVLESFGARTVAKALAELDPDEAVDVLQKMPEDARRRVSSLLPRSHALQAAALIEYPPDTAGGIMTTSVPVLRGDDTVQDALQRLKDRSYDVRDLVVVVDGQGMFIGVVEAGDLILHRPQARLEEIARRPRMTVTPEVDQEEVARAMLRYYLRRLPVVDGSGRFLGVIAIEDVAYVVAEEATEDIAKIAGLGSTREAYTELSIVSMARIRLPWLLAVYLFQSLTAGVLKQYEAVIASTAALAAFIPLVMGAGGNVGGQSVALLVRALALGQISERSLSDLALVVAKEAGASMIIGAVLSLAGAVTAYLMTGDTLMALAVSSSLLLVVMMAGVSGAVLPVVAKRLGVDPASISTPLITSLVDLGVAAIYMAIASLLIARAGI